MSLTLILPASCKGIIREQLQTLLHWLGCLETFLSCEASEKARTQPLW